MSEFLKESLEYDYTQVKENHRLTILPSKVTVVHILENFVKHFALKSLCGGITSREKLKRRNSQTKPDRGDLPLDTDKFAQSISICKEVADGLRIYFDFILRDQLLYDPEQEQYDLVFDESLLGSYKPMPCERAYYMDNLPLNNHGCLDTVLENSSTEQGLHDDNSKRRLRSCRSDDPDNGLFVLENELLGTESCAPGPSVHNGNMVAEIMKSILPQNNTIPLKVKTLLQNTLAWEMLPQDAPMEPSMIYGPIHLMRLIGKFKFI